MGHRKPLERLACETAPTAQDNLTMDALDAQRAGMSYGKYKSLHPNSMAANEARLAHEQEKPKTRKKRRQAFYKFTCLYCGQEFTTENAQTKYCSYACKSKKNGELYRRRHGVKERNLKND